MISNSKVQYLIVLLLFITVNLISYFTQPRIPINDGKGWDGVEYFETAKQFSDGKLPSGKDPLITRIGTPFLASLLDKDDLLNGFFYANLIANLFSCLLLFYFLKIYLNNFNVLICLIALYLFNSLCNTKFIYFCPVVTDPWGLTFFLIGLILVEKFRKTQSNKFILLLSVCSFVGVMFREYILVIPVAFLFLSNPFARKNFITFSVKKMFSSGALTVIPLLSGIAGLVTARLIVNTTPGSFSFLEVVIYFLFERPLMQYVHSWLVAIGPVIAILLFFYKDVFRFLGKHQHLLILLIAVIVLSFIGGTDVRRFILWFIPVILLLIGIIIENNLRMFRKPLLIISLIVFQSISMKVFTKIPEPVHPTTELGVPILPVLGNEGFLKYTSLLGDDKFEFISFLKYVLAVGFLLLILRYYYQKTVIAALSEDSQGSNDVQSVKL